MRIPPKSGGLRTEGELSALIGSTLAFDPPMTVSSQIQLPRRAAHRRIRPARINSELAMGQKQGSHPLVN